MMGGSGGWPTGSDGLDPQAEMPVSPAAAVAAAQAYLDRNLEGVQADENADRFYGYYTLHIERDGATVGMLSVHGSTGQVFLHTWHGDFVEMTEDHGA